MPRAILVRDPRIPSGGFETWVEVLAAELPAHGVDVTLLVPGGEREASQIRNRFPAARVLAVAVHDAPAAQATAIIDALRDLAADGESGVFFSLGYIYLAIVGINLLRSPWLPLPVIHGRDPGIVPWISVGPPRRIVMVSQNMVADVDAALRRQVGAIRAWRRVVAVEHGVVIPDADAVHAKLARSAVAPYRLVAASRLDVDVKRPFDYVDIAAAIKRSGLPFRMTLAGTGPAEAEVRARAAALSVDDVLTMTGGVSRDDVYRLMLDADLFVLTSEMEASSLVMREALASGCAVIAAANPGTEALRESGAVTLVPPGDVDAFAAALASYAREPERIRRDGRAARAYAERHFSQEAMVARYAELVQRLARHAKPNRRWTPPQPLWTTPADALPRTLGARLRNRLAGIVESFTS